MAVCLLRPNPIVSLDQGDLYAPSGQERVDLTAEALEGAQVEGAAGIDHRDQAEESEADPPFHVSPKTPIGTLPCAPALNRPTRGDEAAQHLLPRERWSALDGQVCLREG